MKTALSIESRAVGHLVAFWAVVLFALNVPATTYLLGEGWLTPRGYALLRLMGGTVICWLVSLFVKQEPVASPKDYLHFALAGSFGLGLFSLFYGLGLGMTSPIDASIILTLTPVMVFLISVLFLKEGLTWGKVLGILLAMGGALLVILLQGSGDAPTSLWGNVVVLLAATIYGLYLLYTRDIAQRYHPVILLRWVFLFGFLLYLPFCIDPFLGSSLLQHPSVHPLLVALFVAVFPSAIAFMLLPIAMKSLSITVVSMYNYAIPVVASGVAVAVGQAHLQWDDAVAALLVVVGVSLVNKQKKSR